MVTRNGSAPDPHDGSDLDAAVLRQRSARTDPGMRDGDSGRGNPYESDGDDPTSDNDIGDTHPTAGDPDLDDLTTDENAIEARLPETYEDVPPEAGPVDDGTGDVMEGGGRPDENADRTQLPGGMTNNVPDRANRPADVNTPAVAHRGGGDDDTLSAAAGMPADGPPVPGYEKLTVAQVVDHAGSLPADRVRAILDYERAHRGRKTLVTRLERHLKAGGG